MKKSSLIALALAATLVLGGGGVFAAGQIARSRAISEENARNFAYVDAGILPEDAEFVSTKFDFEKGRFVYEIEFVSQGIKYEYVLDSVSGEVLEKEKEAVRESRGRASEPASETLPAVIFEETLAPLIGLAEAKARAAEELGQPLSQLNFLEAELIRKEGEPVYSLELKDPEGGFHQFEFNAYSGEVLKESHRMAEETKAATDPVPTDLDPTDPAPTQPAPTGADSTDPAPTQPVPVTPDPTGQAPTNPV
ncbi:MAG: PepSY domain-containing protein, partial [Lachnospiraceae bacterium]|nr:PepSY domain-containing protein [Lachnospiraceae bacterium]